jgi:hypothetical protein
MRRKVWPVYSAQIEELFAAHVIKERAAQISETLATVVRAANDSAPGNAGRWFHASLAPAPGIEPPEPLVFDRVSFSIKWRRPYAGLHVTLKSRDVDRGCLTRRHHNSCLDGAEFDGWVRLIGVVLGGFAG